MAEQDDKRESPLSSRRGEGERDWRSATVTQDEFRGELTDLRAAVDKGFDRLSSEIKHSEEQWRERTHELAQTAQTQAIVLALQGQRIDAIERAAKDEKEDRRWLWGAVISAAGLIGGVVAWLTEFVKHRP